MAGTFQDSVFTGNISSWNVENVWNFVESFRGTSYNGDLRAWDLRNASTLRFMFADTTAFDGNISVWKVSGVLDMHGMCCKTLVPFKARAWTSGT